MRFHTINCFWLRHGPIIDKTLYILFAGVLLSVSGYGGYFSMTEYMSADHRVQLAQSDVKKAEANTREYQEVLAGKTRMIEPVSDKYAKMAKVKVEWELVEVVN